MLLLGELLKGRGIRFDVLSRGYGRTSKGVRSVDPAGLPQNFGDEPLLVARKLQVPVIVGEKRYEAGSFAESKFGPQLHLLDDGFQHRALVRDFDIVLLTPQDAADKLLPAGRLREPMHSLRRADAVVLAGGASAESFPLAGKLVWRVRREPVAEAFYRDHHAYGEKDVRELLALKQRSEAGGFITTEKDAVNLGGYLSALEPLAVVPVKMELSDAANVVDTMLHMINERKLRP